MFHFFVVFFPAIRFVNIVKVLHSVAAARDALCGASSHEPSTHLALFFFRILRLFSSIKTDGSVGGTMQESRISIHSMAHGKFIRGGGRRIRTQNFFFLFFLPLKPQITFYARRTVLA